MTALSTNGSVEELREDIPLRKPETPKVRFWNIICCNWYFGDDCTSGLGLIYSSFATISMAITFILALQIYYGAYQILPHGSVVSDFEECSSAGVLMLKKGGNAVDAAVATAICMAVVNPHTTGLAAGGVLMIYSHRLRNLPTVIDFGPGVNMDGGQLPRLINGLAFAHNNYGLLPWNLLLQPSIELAKNGFIIPKTLFTAIELSHTFDLFEHPLPGQNIHLPALANALEIIANLTEDHLESLVTSNVDLMTTSAINTTFLNYNIYVPNIPANGPVLLSVVENLKLYNFTQDDVWKPEYTYRLAEIVLNTYSELNITSRLYENTASTVVTTDKDDLYVVVVTGLNGMLGSHHMSPAGFLLDNPPISTGNPETLALPVIITDANYVCGQRAIFGTGDVSLATQLISSLLIGSENITETVENSRFRVLNENEIGVEANHMPSFNEDIIAHLHSIGKLIMLSEPYDSINMIQIIGDALDLHSDTRGGGVPSKF